MSTHHITTIPSAAATTTTTITAAAAAAAVTGHPVLSWLNLPCSIRLSNYQHRVSLKEK